MATILTAGTTTATSLVIASDTSGTLAFVGGTGTAMTIASGVVTLTTPLAITSGGTGTNTATGSGYAVLATSPSMASPTFTGTPIAPTATVGTNTTQIATTAFVQTGLGTVNSVIAGTIQMWPTVSAPSGYLLCDGTAVSRTTYATLFGVVGTTFGTGDGSTTFNLPNYQDRMPIGKGTIATAVGATGGSTDAIVVSHTHTATSTVTDPGHVHSILGAFDTAAPNNGIPVTARGGAGYPTAFNTQTASTNISVATTNATAGVSGTNANLPPYLGINFIIKT